MRKSGFIVAFQLNHFTSLLFIGGTIKVNVLGKTYSYKLPKVVNVKYLSFADFTGKKNAFYFNCPDDCANNKNNAHNRSFLRRRWDQIKSWFKRK